MTQSMPASALMIKEVEALPEAAKLKDVVKALARSRAGAVVLLDASGEITGIISNRDVVTHLGGGGSLSSRANQVMTKSPACALTTTPIGECAKLMQERKCRQLPIVDQGRLVGLLTISELQNVLIEDMKESMVQLKEAHQKLALRDEYLGIVAHDVRSPLGVVQSCCEYLEETLKTGTPLGVEETLGLVESIRASAHSGMVLVEELVDIGRLNSGSKLQRETVDLGVLIQDVMKQLKPVAAQKNIRFTFEAKTGVSAVVDRSRIARALDNIINNAIKFTPGGRAIHLACELHPGISSRPQARLIVRDEGPGIPQDKLGRLFRKFDQLESPLANLGFGLGLSIAHQFVALHKGRIEVENHQQGGAQFTIILPDAFAAGEAASVKAEARRVLIVDDDPDTLEVLEEVFVAGGYEVLTASDGAQGLTEARRIQPDLVVTDVKMPVMDGLMFLSQLRKNNPTTPVILVSGHYPTMNEARASTLFKADRFLEKPVDPKDLLAAAAECLAVGAHKRAS